MKTTKKDFRVELEKLISKHSDSILANYISKCLGEFESKIKSQENPFGVQLQEPTINQIMPTHPIPAKIGNNTTTGWSNPFGGTSWGV